MLPHGNGVHHVIAWAAFRPCLGPSGWLRRSAAFAAEHSLVFGLAVYVLGVAGTVCSRSLRIRTVGPFRIERLLELAHQVVVAALGLVGFRFRHAGLLDWLDVWPVCPDPDLLSGARRRRYGSVHGRTTSIRVRPNGPIRVQSRHRHAPTRGPSCSRPRPQARSCLLYTSPSPRDRT